MMTPVGFWFHRQYCGKQSCGGGKWGSGANLSVFTGGKKIFHINVLSAGFDFTEAIQMEPGAGVVHLGCLNQVSK